MPEPLDDDEIADALHRMAFDLEPMSGKSLKGDTALKSARGALLLILAGLVKESEPEPPQRHD